MPPLTVECYIINIPHFSFSVNGNNCGNLYKKRRKFDKKAKKCLKKYANYYIIVSANAERRRTPCRR